MNCEYAVEETFQQLKLKIPWEWYDSSEMYLAELSEKLKQSKQFTMLVEIPPVPWGYSYMVALTHDVDITSK